MSQVHNECITSDQLNVFVNQVSHGISLVYVYGVFRSINWYEYK